MTTPLFDAALTTAPPNASRARGTCLAAQILLDVDAYLAGGDAGPVREWLRDLRGLECHGRVHVWQRDGRLRGHADVTYLSVDRRIVAVLISERVLECPTRAEREAVYRARSDGLRSDARAGEQCLQDVITALTEGHTAYREEGQNGGTLDIGRGRVSAQSVARALTGSSYTLDPVRACELAYDYDSREFHGVAEPCPSGWLDPSREHHSTWRYREERESA